MSDVAVELEDVTGQGFRWGLRDGVGHDRRA
jgi:hypothetical protein